MPNVFYGQFTWHMISHEKIGKLIFIWKNIARFYKYGIFTENLSDHIQIHSKDSEYVKYVVVTSKKFQRYEQ